MKIFLYVLLILTLIGPLWILISGKIDWSLDYRTANRASAHIAPLPSEVSDAVIQVYSARAFNWRGIFASHTWIAVKEKNAKQFKVYQVVGWLLFRGLPALSVQDDIPDRFWFGETPDIILDIRGEKAEKLIPEIYTAAKKYPDATKYVLWPGPNSNTFVSFIARQVPGLQLAVPSDAIGKDYIPEKRFFVRAPSGTGYQFSFYGIFGILIAKKEGIEINILGLVYGIQVFPFAIKLPGVGAVP
jgi:hypothetical protein